MNSKTVSSTQLADQLRTDGVAPSDLAARIAQEIGDEIRDHYPVPLAIVTTITYDTKTDRYVVKFSNGTAKASADVARFLLQHAFEQVARPYVYAHMTDDGTVDAVFLRFI